ncbi:TetR/AcrR family transcriptional regulator [Nocardia asiatica]|uniref:TetR/AcrR family transcriptional regulator n=1 Tax=Nocardia asiatica TaxID=209252 RepID=UPI003EE07683
MTRAAPVSRVSPDNGPDSGFRRRLLDGMAVAVRERGYQDTTVADVVRHARTSRRTFYEHFSSKQDCFIALLSEHHKEMIQRMIPRSTRACPGAHRCAKPSKRGYAPHATSPP